MKIAVLMGGDSSEREVSLKTGHTVVEAIKEIGWKVTPCLYKHTLNRVLPDLKAANVVFNALHGGDGEDGTVQQILEDNHIKYTGSDPEVSSLAMDKTRTKLLLKKNHIVTPEWLHLRIESPGDLEDIERDLMYPVVVKPNADGSTMGISLVKQDKDLDTALKMALEFSSEILIEDYIPGREMTVAILGDSALPIVEILPSHELYDYRCKYTEGMSHYICPADLSVELAEGISKTAETISRLMNCRHYCRVDFRLDHNGIFYCLEVNTLPGLTSLSLVPMAAMEAGISFEKLIKRIIHDAVKER